jgi:hypothetical protein
MSVQSKIEGDKLVLTIDISKAAMEKAQPSSTGKTLCVATTHGFARFGEVSVSLNATIPNPAFKKG